MDFHIDIADCKTAGKANLAFMIPESSNSSTKRVLDGIEEDDWSRIVGDFALWLTS
ncbi:hypothetical protein C8R48DRAFT_701134 [Suillus tomentosus]|nr:hypothetical protein C8R48DRAFT_701134 [Suillus tomentosus]